MKKTFPFFFVMFSIILAGSCSEDEAENCKLCDEISDTTMSAEICDNGDGTASYTVFVAGQTIVSDDIELDDDQDIEDFDCSFFNSLGTDDIEESNK